MTTETATQIETPAAPAIPWDEMEAAQAGCTRGIDRQDMEARAGTIRKALENGATVAQLVQVAAANRASRGDKIKISTKYGHLSRGKAWARQGSGSSVTWAEKDGGTVWLTEGKWVVGSDDGFRRSQKDTWTVTRVAGVLIGE